MNVCVRIFNMTETLDTIKFTPEKSKQIALARLDLIHKWLEFRRNGRLSKAPSPIQIFDRSGIPNSS